MVLVLSMVLTVAAVDAGKPDAGTADSGVAQWRLSQKLAKGSALREALIADLVADAGKDPRFQGEAPLSRVESEALLDDPRAELIYGAKTVSIAAPSMLTRQRNDHLDLMKLFLLPERINAGVAFVKEHRDALERATEKHGVDYEVIIGILTWESKLGTITGDYKAFNALASQAYFLADASAVALASGDEKKLLDDAAQQRRVTTIRDRGRHNLVSLIRQCKARGIDVLEVKGSWAGALGFPQFMPASLQWAEDGDGDGKIDLFTFDDAIFSIAKYLGDHGFRKDKKRAVWDYNHEDAYVQGVLAYAEALRSRMSPDAGPWPDGGKR